MRRYYCPVCGKGRNAPDMMPKLDTRRWCLDCSASSSTLVPMLKAPTAERAKEIMAMIVTNKARRQEERRKRKAKQVAEDIAAALAPKSKAKTFWQRFWQSC